MFEIISLTSHQRVLRIHRMDSQMTLAYWGTLHRICHTSDGFPGLIVLHRLLRYRGTCQGLLDCLGSCRDGTRAWVFCTISWFQLVLHSSLLQGSCRNLFHLHLVQCLLEGNLWLSIREGLYLILSLMEVAFFKITTIIINNLKV